MAKDQSTLGLQEEKREGPVECLGMTFESDEARREHFLSILREKLQDPEFRKIEGFPIGEDEDILALSDPPYYTACPNPFLEDFIKCYGKPYDPETDDYHREPFAADVSEGRHTWIYKAHTYHTKVPPEAIRQYIQHYLPEGGVTLDAFCGSGMTGVASRLVREANGACILCDLSPASTFISSVYSADIDVPGALAEAEQLLQQAEAETQHLYSASSQDGGVIAYTVWSECLICDACDGEFVFWDAAYDVSNQELHSSFDCPHCGVVLKKTDCRRAVSTQYDELIGEAISQVKVRPVMVSVVGEGKRQKRRPTRVETEIAQMAYEVHDSLRPELFMHREGDWGDQWRDGYHKGITHAHQFFFPRTLFALSAILAKIDMNAPEGRFLAFVVSSCLQKMSKLMVFNADGIGRVQKGTLYISSIIQEMNPFHLLRISLGDCRRAWAEGLWKRANGATLVTTSSATDTRIPDNTMDYVFVDPPFGDNLAYSELNFLWEWMLHVFTDSVPEAIVSNSQGKGLPEYTDLMRRSFTELRRALKPGHWVTVVFHNSQNRVWNAIQEGLQSAGFVVADVRTLDKKQGAFNQVVAAGAVKQDLVISAYKPNGGLEERFRLEAGTEDGVWDFVRTHLRQLPVFVSKEGQVEVVAERQDYLLFDRMVAFHVQRGVTIPLSAAEFYAGLRQRFPERDGMFFLPEQVTEYDRKRLSAREVMQLQLFVTDESSAIQWVRQQLLRKPQTFQDLQPQFMQEVKAWLKHEKTLELAELLAQNFLCYDGDGEVPSQIHAYLSSAYHDLRNLAKDDPALVAQAVNRWYVPDPNKEADLEKIRLRSLMKEFEEYRATKGKLKVVRTEALRAGFKTLWGSSDYAGIVDLAKRLPEAILQEDPRLLMYYDNALMRLEG